jgi:hypothetical protein
MTHRRALVGCGALALLVLFVVIKLAPGRGGGDGTRIAGGFSDAPFGPRSQSGTPGSREHRKKLRGPAAG